MSSVYEIITDKIIEGLEKNLSFSQSWSSGFPRNYVSEKEYRGINILLLNSRKYKSRDWLTFNQIKKLNGSVKKGSKSSMCIYYTTLEKEDKKTEKIKTIPLLRYYKVFNWEQTIDIPEKKQEHLNDNEKIQRCEDIVENYKDKPVITNNQTSAYYSPLQDYVSIPEIRQFNNSENYYSVLFHELTHSTGHKKRLNREGITKISGFGTQNYSFEELVAEIGACYLNNYCQIETENFDNSAAYVKGWVRVLKNDKTMIVKASKEAQKAYEYIRGIEEEN